jgi:hypothetical protein
MMRWISRHAFELVALGLVSAIVVLGGFLVGVALPDLARQQQPVRTPLPSPAHESPMAGLPGGVLIAADADCAGCHLGQDGTVAAKRRPLMLHPIEGWRDCTACHAPGRLVTTAPGHSGLHREDCLVCHSAPAAGTAAPRPHHVFAGSGCISCHGVEAPLPIEMAERRNCWICHGLSEVDLFVRPAPPPAPAP